MRIVRLGQGVDRTGRLAEASLERAFAAVDEYMAIVQQHDVAEIRFCATSAARDAENADEFVAGVRERVGVEPEVIDGDEEARVSFAGATRDAAAAARAAAGARHRRRLDRAHPRAAADGTIVAAQSLDIGSVRLTERHLHDDPPSRTRSPPPSRTSTPRSTPATVDPAAGRRGRSAWPAR